VTVLIVRCAEMVQIDDCETEWMTGSKRALQFRIQHLGKAAPVEHAGQWIMPGQFFDLVA